MRIENKFVAWGRPARCIAAGLDKPARSHGSPWSTILFNISYTWLNGAILQNLKINFRLGVALPALSRQGLTRLSRSQGEIKLVKVTRVGTKGHGGPRPKTPEPHASQGCRPQVEARNPVSTPAKKMSNSLLNLLLGLPLCLETSGGCPLEG